MKRSRSDLVLLTLDYPFGKGESFIENEINFLSKAFRKVYVVPSNHRHEIQRELPANTTLIRSVSEGLDVFSIKERLQLFPYFLKVFLFSMLKSRERHSYIKHFRSMIHHFLNDLRKRKLLGMAVDEYDLKDAIFYDYWLLNSSLSLIHLKTQGKIGTCIARAHGFDLYSERHYERTVPFREFKLWKMDRIATISNHGERYLNSCTDGKLKNKIRTFYLGVPKPKSIPQRSSRSIIVSCSAIIDLKQVDKIAKAIGQLSENVLWIHFGDGDKRKEVEEVAKKFPSNVKFELKGNRPYNEVLSYYSSHYVKAFISLSKTEGLPVSMMEVQSYGIPIIAPDINGIPEIVNDETGFLLKKGYKVEEVSSALSKILNNEIHYDRDRIRAHYLNHFNDATNYQQFMDEFILGVE